MDHEQFMRQCIEIGKQAKAQGESPVGSIIVRDGKVIATAMEASKQHQDITYHAEIEAIRHATALLGNQDLSGCTMYTTHEPCIMCAYVIRHTKISYLVIGITIPSTGGFSSKLPLLKETLVEKWGTPPEVITGVLEEECKALHT